MDGGGRRRSRRRRRSTTGTSASPPSATGRTAGPACSTSTAGSIDIVNNYEHLSFNVGPTLLSWLETHRARGATSACSTADRAGGGAIAQAYNHMILPLANERDVRTQVRWGLADFEHRFGRAGRGHVAARDRGERRRAARAGRGGRRVHDPGARPGGRVRSTRWRAVSMGASGRQRTVDRPSSSTTAHLPRPRVRAHRAVEPGADPRAVVVAAGDGTPVCVATDGETFGHHHKFADRALAYAFSHEARRRRRAGHERRRNSSTRSRPTTRCACTRAPGRAPTACGAGRTTAAATPAASPAGTRRGGRRCARRSTCVRDHGAEVFERRGRERAARPVGGPRRLHRRGPRRRTHRRLPRRAQPRRRRPRRRARRCSRRSATRCSCTRRAAGSSTTSPGIETVQILRYAARAIDLLDEIGEPVD